MDIHTLYNERHPFKNPPASPPARAAARVQAEARRAGGAWNKHDTAALRERFEAADLDHDGHLTRAEFNALRAEDYLRRSRAAAARLLAVRASG